MLVVELEIVGFAVVLQQTPLEVTVAPPSLVTLPPVIARSGLLSLSQRNYETLKIVPELVSPESTLGIIRILRGLTFFLATQAVVVGVDMR